MITTLARRLVRLCAVTAASLALLAPAAQAADAWPAKPVRVIVPYAPGGAGDSVARPFAEKLSQALGQQFVVDNRGGAAGAIGVEAVVRSAADGYTLLITPMGAIVILPHLRKTVYDPMADVQPVARLAETVAAMAVVPSLGVKTVKEFIALAKAKPGTIYFGSSGQGTITQMRGEILKRETGIDIVHVPYRGSAEALSDILAGNIQVFFEGIVIPHCKAGTLVCIATLDTERNPDLPDVPTMAEAGLPSFNAASWHGLFAPKGTPREIVERLAAETRRIAELPDVREQMLKVGLRARGDTPEAMAAAIRKDSDYYGAVIRDAHITLQ